jgi:hypothetical protein
VPGRNGYAGAKPALRLRLDDRDVLLEVGDRPARELGLSQWPLRTPGRAAQLALYVVEPQLLRQIGAAGILRLRPESDSSLTADVWFTDWRSGARAFRGFADRVLPAP